MTDGERLARAALDLGEHFDSVRVVATRNNGAGETSILTYGSGNFCAQVESCRGWVARMQALSLRGVID